MRPPRSRAPTRRCSSAASGCRAGSRAVPSSTAGSAAETTRCARESPRPRAAPASSASRAADALAAAARLVPPPSSAADARWAGLTAPVLAVHPGAGGRAKRWDIAGFVQVAHWWRSRGGSVVAIAGPAEAGEPPALGAPEVRDWPLVDLAAVLARAALYLGNDSGVSHLAGAVGAAGVVLFGPTDARRWRPLARRLVALGARGGGPDGIPLAALPAARVIAACARRFALTRRDPDTNVAGYDLSGRS